MQPTTAIVLEGLARAVKAHVDALTGSEGEPGTQVPERKAFAFRNPL